MSSKCNVLIYGGGAVGSIFGWRLAQRSTNRVSVVCRSNFERVRNTGYALKTVAWGSGRFIPDQVFKAGHVRRPTIGTTYDYVICSNKFDGDLTPTLRDLSGIIRSTTTLVTAQNGMDVEMPLRRAFPENTILTTICNIGCSQVLPGLVEQTADLKRKAFLIGVPNHEQNKRKTAIRSRDALAAMDSEFDSIECVAEARWRKLIFNCAWNSTTALTGLNTHELLQRAGASQMILQLAQEAYTVAIASGVELDSQMPYETVKAAATSAPITPSTLQDARNKRPMELTPIFGYLVMQAAKVGVQVPCITLMYDLLRQMNDAFVTRQTWQVPDMLLPAVEQLLGREQIRER